MWALVVTKGEKMAWEQRKERQLVGLDFSGVWVGREFSGVTGCEYRAVESSDSKIGNSQ